MWQLLDLHRFCVETQNFRYQGVIFFSFGHPSNPQKAPGPWVFGFVNVSIGSSFLCELCQVLEIPNPSKMNEGIKHLLDQRFGRNVSLKRLP